MEILTENGIYDEQEGRELWFNPETGEWESMEYVYSEQREDGE